MAIGLLVGVCVCGVVATGLVVTRDRDRCAVLCSSASVAGDRQALPGDNVLGVEAHRSATPSKKLPLLAMTPHTSKSLPLTATPLPLTPVRATIGGASSTPAGTSSASATATPGATLSIPPNEQLTPLTNPPTPTASASVGFVGLSGQEFTQDGVIIHPYGSTMYPYWQFVGTYVRGSGWAHPEFTQYIDQMIALAQQAHLNVLRPTDFFDGVTYGDWYNVTVWSNMDYLLQQAAVHRMHVILDLSPFRNQNLKQGIYPYNASDYSAAFAWVARRYADNRALLNYSIAGEVKCPTSSDPLRPTATSALTAYFQQLSDTIRAADPNHLISSGGLSYLNESNCGIDWKAIESLPNINVVAIHVYSENDRTITMPLVSAWAAAAHKPFTVEEFGFHQSLGDQARAAAYQRMYDLGRQYNATTMVLWNLGLELAPSSYEVNAATPLTWSTVIQNAP